MAVYAAVAEWNPSQLGIAGHYVIRIYLGSSEIGVTQAFSLPECGEMALGLIQAIDDDAEIDGIFLSFH